MKKIFRKNQIIITTLAIMIAVAGYLNFTGTKSDDRNGVQETAEALAEEDVSDISEEDIFVEYSLSDDGTELEQVDDEVPEDGQTGEDEGTDEELWTEEPVTEDGTGEESTDDGSGQDSIPGEAVLTTSVNNAAFVAEARLQREQIRARNKETLLEMIDNTNIKESQKQSAIDRMITLTDISEREAAAELLLEAKGFQDIVVSITDDSADVVVNMSEVTDAKRAQIEDIMKRKTGVSAENIVITPIHVE